jgi:hypothetical protein
MTAPSAGEFQPYLLHASRRIILPRKRGTAIFVRLDRELTVEEQALETSTGGFWLFRAESGICGVLPVDFPVLANGKIVRGLAVLHHGLVIECQSEAMKCIELFRLQVQDGDHSAGRRCAYCAETTSVGDLVLHCPQCRQIYHEECWDALVGTRCLGRGCVYSPGKIEV